jgi:hypothetical protein
MKAWVTMSTRDRARLGVKGRGTTVRLAGEPIRLRFVPPASVEDQPWICCMAWPPLLLPDNIRAPCATCGRMIQYRPDAPRRPLKVCARCIVDLTAEKA